MLLIIKVLIGAYMKETFLESDFGGAIPVKDLIGKSVITAEGKQIGKIGEVLIDPIDLCLRGLVVRRGLITTDLFISKDYIKNLSKDRVELSADPFIESTEIKVFNVNGKQIGKVKSITRADNSHRITAIVIDQEAK
ncbi:MAG: PRC-barrel domain-containing protein [Candidatus Diapherotrites archaeon]|nr:PRC-barrel domain-containing protein [Candidatus Diapherotrites archaeon]